MDSYVSGAHTPISGRSTPARAESHAAVARTQEAVQKLSNLAMNKDTEVRDEPARDQSVVLQIGP